jgi:hypothetical protein
VQDRGAQATTPALWCSGVEARRRLCEAARLTASSTRGGDATAVPAKGAEGDGGSR